MSIREKDQNYLLRKNINVVTMPTHTFDYVILENRSYTREDTRLYTLISYVLLLMFIHYFSSSPPTNVLDSKVVLAVVYVVYLCVVQR